MMTNLTFVNIYGDQWLVIRFYLLIKKNKFEASI